VICPNQIACGAISWEKDDVFAMDVKAAMDEFVNLHLGGNWKRLVRKIEDKHLKLKSLLHPSMKQKKKRAIERANRSRSYAAKFPEFYGNFPTDCVPTFPRSGNIPLASQQTSSYGLYNNVAFRPDILDPYQKMYLIGHSQSSANPTFEFSSPKWRKRV